MQRWMQNCLSLHASKTLFPSISYDHLRQMMEKQKEEYQIMNQKKIYPQQRVLLSEPNSPILLAKMGALWEQNAIPCLLSPSMNRPNREHCISLLQKEPYGQQQEALILFTSGTSSLPKGVVLSHTNLTSQLEMLHQHIPMNLLHDHSRSVALLPWTHCYGLIGECLMMMQRGGSLSPLPKFNIFHYLWAIQQQQPTTLFMVPYLIETMYKMYSSLPFRCPPSWFFGNSLEYIVSGGAYLCPEIKKKVWEEMGIPILEGYGCTEMSPMISVQTEFSMTDTSVGTLLSKVECEIREKEIYVRGPNRFLHYLPSDNTSNNISNNTSNNTSNLWYGTGDYGYVKENKLYLIGRNSDVIKLKNGRFFRLKEVEDFLFQYFRQTMGDVLLEKVVAWQHPTKKTIGATLFYSNPNHFPSFGKLQDMTFQHQNIELFLASSKMLCVTTGWRTMKGEICRYEIAKYFRTF